ncbi:golgin subfamily A member 2-like [Pongo abelii]|uniref:golgin subfamily A member 2-like n=1 Tax=Pongo abelii TaxID=9601 RepID=UPI0023E83C76|nr:golgin subfamily A member 2-like [Pongo abelii]
MPLLAQSHSCRVADWRHSAVLTGISLMWPQPCLPPHPAMSEKTRQGKLAEARKKNENKSALQLEQQVKELQEKLGDLKGTVTSDPSKKVAFFNSAGTSAQEEQRMCCQRLAHPVALSQKEPEAAAPARELGSSFMDLLKEKVDLTERVEKLKLQFFHLSGKTDTMRKYITPYGSQRAVPKMQHREEDMIRLAQDQEEMKIFVR